MNEIPQPILDVLERYNVLSMAISSDDIPWSASAFYAFDAAEQRLIFLSSLDTHHAKVMLINPNVAGTVTCQFDDIGQIHGIQFQGIARLLDSTVLSVPAQELYFKRFPGARGMSAPVWDIRLLRLKLTDNRLGFGTKIRWSRHDGETPSVMNHSASNTTATSSQGTTA